MLMALSGGVQFPTTVPILDGFVHSISEISNLVNTNILQQTDTKQFKRWFGDWVNHPKKVGKAIDPYGKAFEFAKIKEAELETGSSPKELTSGGIPIESASRISIFNPEKKVKESFDIKEQDVQQIKSSIPFAPLFPNRIGRLRQLIHDPLPAGQTNPEGRGGSDQTLKNAAYIGKRNEARSILVLVKNIDS